MIGAGYWGPNLARNFSTSPDWDLAELWRPAHFFDVMPRPVQLVRQLIDRALKRGRIKIVREQIHVVSETIDHSVLTDRAGARQSERAAVKGSERNGG